MSVKGMKKIIENKIVNVIIKLLLTVAVLFISSIIGFILSVSLSANRVNLILAFCSTLIFPGIAIPLIYFKKRKKVFKWWGIFVLVYTIALVINFAKLKYDEKITINTTPNINCGEYLPFVEDTKIVKLGYTASLKLVDNLPIIDGAAALFPVYSAFVNATYPNTVKLYDGIFEYNNTVLGYELLAEKKTDVFFGVYPSEAQINYAKEHGTQFEYTQIGTEAFVFFVHKDNPVESLTTEQIQGIYSGKITNWKEVGGKNEEIVAFQRNQGSGSQSMLIRFMGDVEIMEAPKEQINDFMMGIIDRVANYKNKTNSIGFSFRYYLEGIIQNPDVKMLSVDGIKPTVNNIKSGAYSITTPLYAVTYKDNVNVNVKKLLDWVLSSEGQEIIEKTGYVGVN